MSRLPVKLWGCGSTATHKHLLLLLLRHLGLLVNSSGGEATEHNVCGAENTLRTATTRELSRVRGDSVSARLLLTAVGVLSDAVRPQRIRDHAAANRSAREGRSLALSHGPFPRSETRSNLAFLFLLDGVAVLLGQLVVVHFGERAHRSVALALLLRLGCCVGAEEAREILGRGAGS